MDDRGIQSVRGAGDQEAIREGVVLFPQIVVERRVATFGRTLDATLKLQAFPAVYPLLPDSHSSFFFNDFLLDPSPGKVL
jgi:hypothetical protein